MPSRRFSAGSDFLAHHLVNGPSRYRGERNSESAGESPAISLEQIHFEMVRISK